MEYKTKDLQHAAWLMVRNYPLLRVERAGKARVFVFGNCPEEEAMKYYQGEANVDARQLFAAYFDCKSLVFDRE